MSVQVENLEKNMAKLVIEVSAQDLDKALDAAYNKQKKNIALPGFRKGKAPRKMVEKMYGSEVFFEDAANLLIQTEYAKALDEVELDVVSQPTIDVKQMEQGKSFIFEAEVAVKPEVTLGKYMGVTVTKIDTSVSDEEVMEKIDAERKNNARQVTVEDRAAAMGDTVVIDFDGYVDGEAFEGGKMENYSLELGSHSFIDTFEDQLVGKKAGDDVEVNVTFPEEYHATELAGKPAVFKVKVHEVKEQVLPELDDEFVQDVSEFDTVDAYKENVKTTLESTKAANAKRAKEEEAIKKIVDKSKMDIPEAMIDFQVQQMMQQMSQQMMQQGLTMDQYMQFTGMTVDTLKEQARPEALRRIQTSLVLEAIAKEENIQIADEKVDEEIESMAKMYNMEADKLKGMMSETDIENMKKDLAVQAAVDLIMENIKERAKPKTKKDKEAEAEADAE